MLQDPLERSLIAITTQVVEAGVDVSAKVLFTELAPWPSLVQRFGRCNRKGEYNDSDGGQIYWIDIPIDNKSIKNPELPYNLDELTKARGLLKSCDDNVSPQSLDNLYKKNKENVQFAMLLEYTHVLRRQDLIDLFDTTPDLAGNDIDIARFIRSGEELDIQVFWREWPEDKNPMLNQDSGTAPHRNELCSVPVYEFINFQKKTAKNNPKRIRRWDGLKEKWIQVNDSMIYPGQTFLVHCKVGGYEMDTGWASKSNKQVEPVIVSGSKFDSNGHDERSIDSWQTISQHTKKVYKELDTIIDSLQIEDECKEALRIAARWHDYGKAHPAFQAKIKQDVLESEGGMVLEDPYPAKAPDYAWVNGKNTQENYRPHFRHELASALAMLQKKTAESGRLSRGGASRKSTVVDPFNTGGKYTGQSKSTVCPWDI